MGEFKKPLLKTGSGVFINKMNNNYHVTENFKTIIDNYDPNLEKLNDVVMDVLRKVLEEKEMYEYCHKLKVYDLSIMKDIQE